MHRKLESGFQECTVLILYIRRLFQSICSEIYQSVAQLGWISLYGHTTNYPSAHGQLGHVENYERRSSLYEQHGFDQHSFVLGRMTDVPVVWVHQVCWDLSGPT